MIEFGVESGIEQMPFLIKSTEGQDNDISFVIAMPVTGEKGQSQEKTEIPALDKILSACTPLYPDENDTYEIIFENYILHMTSNESFSFGNPDDVRSGDYFVIFEKSKLLDHLTDFAELGIIEARYGKDYKHYGIFCQNHTIDIITATKPIVRRNNE